MARRLATWIGRSGLAAMLIAGAVVEARQVAPERAPASWLAYAEATTRTVEGWLAGDDPQSEAMRTALATGPAEPGGPLPSVTLRLWIARDGTISRSAIDAPPAGIAPDGIFVGRRLAKPPRRMPQPLRLALDPRRAEAGADRPAMP